MRWLTWLVLLGLVVALVFWTATPTSSPPKKPDRTGPGSSPETEPVLPPPPPEPQPAGWRTVPGIVIDADTREPVAGALVRVTFGGRRLDVHTDARGMWRMALPPRMDPDYVGKATAKGYLPADVCVTENWGKILLRVAGPVLLQRADATVSGVVLGPEGSRLPAARIAIDEIWRASTNGRGRFGPIPVRSGLQMFYVIAPDLPRWVFETTVTPGERRELTIRMPPESFATGTIVNDLGQPIEDARLWCEWDPELRVVRTGADGRFRWPLLPERTVDLIVEAEGHFHADPPLRVLSGWEQAVVLERGVFVSGRVVTADGSPLPGRLIVRLGDRHAPIARDGTFRLGPAPPASSGITVSRLIPSEPPWSTKEWTDLASHPEELRPGDRKHDLIITIAPPGLAGGQVVSARTNAPVPSAIVNGLPVGADGAFHLPFPRDDPQTMFLLHASAPGFIPLRMIFRPRRAPKVRLLPSRSMTVRVVDGEGRPHPGAWITMRGVDPELRKFIALGATGADGACRVEVPADRSVSIHASLAGAGWISGRRECGPGEAMCSILLRRPERNRSILAVDENGTPLPGAWFDFGNGMRFADAAGRIRVSGRHGGWVGAPGRQGKDVDREDLPEDGALTVKLGRSAPVRGRVLDTRGRPVVGLRVGVGHADVLTDRDGRFEVDGNARGKTVPIEVVSAGSHRILVTTVAGGPEVELRIPARGRLHVRWKGSGRARFRLFRGGTWDRPDRHVESSGSQSPFVRSEPGSLHFDLEGGTYGLRIAVPPGRARIYPALRIDAGSVVELTYDFPRFGRLAGRVLDARALPATGAEVCLAAGGASLAEVDERGRFEVVHESLDPEDLSLVAGRFRLVIRLADHAPFYTEPIDLERSHDLDLRLVRGGTVSGRVVDQHEKGFRAHVIFPAPEGDPLFDGRTRDDGRFRLLHVTPGRCRVLVRRGREEPIPHEFEVTDGEMSIVTIRVPR